MTTDAELLVAAITQRAIGVRRVYLSEVWEVASRLWPDAVRRSDARDALGRHLDVAEGLGLLELSTGTDSAGVPPLPAFVILPATPCTPAPPRPRVVWHPVLAWAADLRLNDRQYTRLLAVHRWLRDGGSTRPVVPCEERSLELFDDEKAIQQRDGGETLWGPGRLDLALLRCERTLTPFIWEATGAGRRLLVVENQATFRSVVRTLRAAIGHDYGGVVWGQGRMAAGRIAYANELPIPIHSIDYFGDLDIDGLEIANDTCLAAVQTGFGAGPQIPLWTRLLATRPVPIKPRAPSSEGFPRRGKQSEPRVMVDPDRAARVIRWLPASLHARALDVLIAGNRIPQERMGFEQLTADTDWMEGQGASVRPPST